MASTIISFSVDPLELDSGQKMALKVLVPRKGKVKYTIAGKSVTFRSNGKAEKTVDVSIGKNSHGDVLDLKGSPGLIRISAIFLGDEESRKFTIRLNAV